MGIGFVLDPVIRSYQLCIYRSKVIIGHGTCIILIHIGKERERLDESVCPDYALRVLELIFCTDDNTVAIRADFLEGIVVPRPSRVLYASDSPNSIA